MSEVNIWVNEPRWFLKCAIKAFFVVVKKPILQKKKKEKKEKYIQLFDRVTDLALDLKFW